MTRSLRTLAYLAALAVLLPTTGADAQVRPGMSRPGQQQPERAIRFFLAGGYGQVELDGLNARLAALPEPYTAVGEDLALFGGGIHGRLDRFIIGVEASLFTSIEDAEFGDTRKAELGGMLGSFVLGFSILQTDGFDFYPLVQVGGAAATLSVKERGDPAWDDVLGDPGRSSDLSSMMFMGAAGAGMDYTFRGGFFMGLRGTWGWTPPSDGWSDENGEVLGGPEIDLSGPSVRLMFGFGGRP